MVKILYINTCLILRYISRNVLGVSFMTCKFCIRLKKWYFSSRLVCYVLTTKVFKKCESISTDGLDHIIYMLIKW